MSRQPEPADHGTASDQRQAALLAATQVLAEASTLREAAPLILKAVCEHVGWDAGAIWMVDRNENLLHCLDLWHRPDVSVDDFEHVTRNTAFPPGVGLPGRIWSSGEPAWITDVTTDSNFPRAAAAARQGLHAGFGFPIKVGTDITGVLEFFCRVTRQADPSFLSMLATLGIQIGQFIRRLQTEGELKYFFNLSLDLFCIAGFDGYFKRLNSAWETTLGYSLDELMSQPFLDFVHPDDREQTVAEVERLAEGERTFSFENRYRCKNGEYKWLLWNGAPIIEQQLIYGAARDITRRKTIFEEVNKLNTFLDSIVENIPNMIFVKEAGELKFERINKAGERLLGISRQDLIGKNDYDFFPREQADFFVEKDRAVLEGKQLLDIVEEEIKTKEGRRFIHTRKMPILDESGNPKYLLGISEDITERKILEETRRRYAEAQETNARALEAKNRELAESERRYRQLTEASLDAIVVGDYRGRITLFNPAAEKIFGYTGTEVLGQPLTVLMPAEFIPKHEAGFRRYLETRQPVVIGRTVELRGRRKNGVEFPLELSLSAIDLGGEPQFLGSIRDLTERNRMRAMIVQAERLASIGMLSAGVAHEINNPIAYVANNLVVLERDLRGLWSLLDCYVAGAVDTATAEKAREIAEHIDLPYVRANLDRILSRTRDGVQRVAKIVMNLRGLARSDQPQMDVVHIPELLESSVELIRGRLERRGIRLQVNVEEPSRVRCVAGQIGQVFLNLLVNALQAIESGPNKEAGWIKVCGRQEGPEFLIEVSDNGCGMDTKELPRIFDPFYTTKPVGEGTGLGLAIVHGIVTGHGGRIEVDSERGRGSRFRIFLPVAGQRGQS